MRVRVNQDKLDEVKNQLKPATSIWALAGIIFFFFVPEVLAYFWGDRLKAYFVELSKMYNDVLLQKACLKVGELISENSIINTLIGLGFVYWWYYERAKLRK